MTNEASKMLFFNFCLFSFYRFQITIFITCFEGFYEVLLRHKYFWSRHFCQWNERLFKNLFFIEMYFVSLFVLNERNITTLLLMIHWKCTLVHYANLNSSSIKKSFLYYGSLNKLFHIFQLVLSKIFI